MSLLDKLLGNDRERAATKYAGQESASDRAARQRRTGHRRSIAKAAAQAERWEQRDRRRFR
ncbi:hypothetical protein [Streptomyces sp. BK340]|uniref:hypothetical protein n=1 Tax=Streptomyces sp. BK340 TaxID=2572903 RepID=UPI0011A33AD9|nr:hypothetical protein [Streptomyces sp. BK340]TVZ96493.1 hypothetical protein FB157_103404 [Streptomyces sp. BK340]